MRGDNPFHFSDHFPSRKTTTLRLQESRRKVQLDWCYRIMPWPGQCYGWLVFGDHFVFTLGKVCPFVLRLGAFSVYIVSICQRVMCLIDLPRCKCRLLVPKIACWSKFYFAQFWLVIEFLLNPIDGKPEIVTCHTGYFRFFVPIFFRNLFPLGHLVQIHWDARSSWCASRQCFCIFQKLQPLSFFEAKVRLALLELWCVELGSIEVVFNIEAWLRVCLIKCPFLDCVSPTVFKVIL